MKNLFTIALLLIFFFSYSQDKRVSLKGKITYLEEPVEGVNIYNTNSRFGDISSSKGMFNVSVKEHDTIKISHIKYLSKKIVITKELLNKNFLRIQLLEKTNYLSIVALKSHDLSGNILTDSKTHQNDTIHKKYDLIEDILKLSKKPSHKIYRDTEKPPMNNVDPTGGGGGAAIAFTIPDKANDLRRELRKKKSFPQKLIHEFGVVFFIEELKIPKDKIHHFITYCEGRNIRILYNNKQIIKLITVLTEESEKYNYCPEKD